jgi:hypothetical protein
MPRSRFKHAMKMEGNSSLEEKLSFHLPNVSLLYIGYVVLTVTSTLQCEDFLAVRIRRSLTTKMAAFFKMADTNY